MFTWSWHDPHLLKSVFVYGAKSLGNAETVNSVILPRTTEHRADMSLKEEKSFLEGLKGILKKLYTQNVILGTHS